MKNRTRILLERKIRQIVRQQIYEFNRFNSINESIEDYAKQVMSKYPKHKIKKIGRKIYAWTDEIETKNEKKWSLLVFSGGRVPDYSSETSESKILAYLEKLEAQENERAKKRSDNRDLKSSERAKFSSDIKVGDIFYRSWGYDQTNVDFYQVTKKITDSTFEIREIASDLANNSSSGAYEEVVPARNKFISDAKKARVTPYGLSLTAFGSDGKARKWDGRKLGRTGFGFGH